MEYWTPVRPGSRDLRHIRLNCLNSLSSLSSVWRRSRERPPPFRPVLIMNNIATRHTTRRTLLRGLTLAAAGTCLPAAVAHAATPAAAATAASTETYTLTLVHVGRTGAPTTDYTTHVIGVSGAAAGFKHLLREETESTVTLRVPKGRYLLDSSISVYSPRIETDWIVQPRLDVDGDTTVVFDPRSAQPIDVVPPEAGTEFRLGGVLVEVAHGGGTASVHIINATPTLRMAHQGPAAEPGSVRQWVDCYWKGEKQWYALGYAFTSDRALTGLVRRPKAAELGTLTVHAPAPASGPGYGFVTLEPSGPTAAMVPQPLLVPGSTTFLTTPERGAWNIGYSTPRVTDETPPTVYEAVDIQVRAGATRLVTFDSPVFGPALDPRPGARPAGVRTGNTIRLDLSLLADGEGHLSKDPLFEGASTTLHRNGGLVGTLRGTPGQAEFTVPSPRADYRLSTTAARPGGRVTATWTFTSAASAQPAELPLSVVRFTPELRADGTAAPYTTSLVPVTVQGAAATSGIRCLAVSVSTDAGTTWSRVPMVGSHASVRTPGPGGTVSFRAELTDAVGNTLTQTQIGAYRVTAG
ncbi:serine protease [Streptomyces sp. NPDC094032]|uniref:serine protease n=1 Tax=Streptomyces sp. NPDC094032 TaxID=3155308 RepID=UPI00331D2F86